MAEYSESPLKDLPVHNKNNFKIYHEPDQNTATPRSKITNMPHRNSIYPTTSETQHEQRIVNEAKPQVLLKYLSIRGGQYRSQSHGKNSAKRKKVNGVKAPQ